MIKFLPKKVFLATFKYVPRLAVSLVVENKKGHVLLARRAIPPGKGQWHMPGGFVLKGEPISKCIERVAWRELGIAINAKNAKLQGAFDDLNADPRGHIVDLIYKIKTDIPIKENDETEAAKFFSVLPRRVGFNHKETLRKLGY